MRRRPSCAGTTRRPVRTFPRALDQYGMPQYDKKFGDADLGQAPRAHVPLVRRDPQAPPWWATRSTHPPPWFSTPPSGRSATRRRASSPSRSIAAVQPYDTENKILAMPKLLGRLLDRLRLVQGHRRRDEAGGSPLLREVRFRGDQDVLLDPPRGGPRPRRRWAAPIATASEAVTCTRCHKNASGMDLPEHRRAVYPEVTHRLDFKALGYPDDPALVGGRFYITIGRGAPPK